MKTVWHWKNLAKIAAVVLLAASLWQVVCWLFVMPLFLRTAVALLIGSVVAMLAIERWPGWHYEWDQK